MSHAVVVWNRFYKPPSILAKGELSPEVPPGEGRPAALRFRWCAAPLGQHPPRLPYHALDAAAEFLPLNHILPTYFWATCGFELKCKLGFVASA